MAERRALPDVPVLVAAHAHAVGLVTGDAGELLRAVSLLDAERWPYAHASALEDASRAVRATTGRRRWRRPCAPTTGPVQPVMRSGYARLRRLGVHRRRQVCPGSGHGWGALTPTEHEVVRLICGGATNRQAAYTLYLSPHTVSTHLRHDFVKLGVSSRTEPTRIALAHA